MKKLIVLSVVFALVAAGGLFAADVSATVFTHVNVIETDGVLDGDDEAVLGSSGGFDRLRFEANHDGGNFGAYLRLDGAHWTGGYQGESWWPVKHSAVWDGTAWWKPIDQFKMTIGNFADGAYGKEGWAGWMFYQMPSDVGIVNPANVWDVGGAYHYGPVGLDMDGDGDDDWSPNGGTYRHAFFGGYEIKGMAMEIIPADIFNLVIGLPFFNGGKFIDVLGNIMVQGNLNLDFGNIALTYWGEQGTPITGKGGDPLEKNDFDHTGRFYLSTSIGAIENVGIDFGVGFPLPGGDGDKLVIQDPIAVGLGVKVDINDAFGLKARLFTEFGGQITNDGDVYYQSPFELGFDLLPYYAISDEVKVFVGLGLAMRGKQYTFEKDPKEIDKSDCMLFYFNPYVQIGSEWGPCIYFGFQLKAGLGEGDKTEPNQKDPSKDLYAPVSFSIPVGIQVSY